MEKRILIADDFPIIRAGIKQICGYEFNGMEFGEADNATEVFNLLKQSDWDLLILDIDLAGQDGMAILRQLKTNKMKLPVLVFSYHREDHVALRVLKMGAAGYLSKNTADMELIRAVDQLLNGRKYIS